MKQVISKQMIQIKHELIALPANNSERARMSRRVENMQDLRQRIATLGRKAMLSAVPYRGALSPTTLVPNSMLSMPSSITHWTDF
jgi:hypothetical protein